jgi:hypothetical protein
MAKMSDVVKANRTEEKEIKMGKVMNFMGGNSYEINPLDTLKMVSASSIFGEPQYYRDGAFDSAKVLDGRYRVDRLMTKHVISSLDKYKGKKTSEIMEGVIDEALSYDFGGVLDWAVTLRNDFYMRLNPQVIMVRAAIHPDRQAFTEANPVKFAEVNKQVMSRGDDVISQLTYYLYINGSKNKVPAVLKRSWAKKIETLTAYEVYKYRNHGIGLIDTVRVCHAKSPVVSELMMTGTVKLEDNKKTWETLRASGMSWVEIIDTLGRIPHMALLRNLRGIFKEVDDNALAKKLMAELKAGVEKGKQFPFRYMSASKAVKGDEEVNNKPTLITGLEECLDVSCANLPELKGKSAFLTDNSGSAWGTCNSEYGTVTIAEINNLSSVIGASNSEEGYVYAFGDELIEYPISKRVGVLKQAEDISKDAKANVGQGTENGVWLFFEKAVKNKEHWDNIFIYSDMQAGHGGLYGTSEGQFAYQKLGLAASKGSMYVDVVKLIDWYRKEVNPKVNVYCIQTAGYDNVLVPENGYRTNILYGWTGKELVYADSMNKFWDSKES